MKIYNIQFQASYETQLGTLTYSGSINHPRMLTPKGLLRVLRKKEEQNNITNKTTAIHQITHSTWSV
jgi:hypothetical protein